MSHNEPQVHPEIGASWRARHTGGDLDLNPADDFPTRESYTSTRLIANAPIGNPGPLGLYAFGFTTALLQGAVTTITAGQPTIDFTACFAMFYGGLIQLLAGMWEMWKNNTFAATAFSSYGGFWMGWALYQILHSANIWTGESSGKIVKNYSGVTTEEMMLSLWGILTFLFFIQTLRINRALQTLFFSLAVLFFLLAGGVKNALCNKVAGWVGIWVALVAFYCATAILTGEVWDYEYLPLGHVRRTAPPAKAKADAAPTTAERWRAFRGLPARMRTVKASRNAPNDDAPVMTSGAADKV
ncbi:g6978 [Coccomyxa elongata]